jgi:methyltransferase (TIGR00027 family)
MMADSTPIDHVSDTSFWIAAYRAKETRRPDALFRDPLASVLADDRGELIAREMGNASRMAWAVAIRTVIIDDLIRDAIGRGVDTVLNLGAGLDTRPYRLDLPENLRWIEVDFPQVISYKTMRLGGEPPKCDLERIGLDLANVEDRERIFSSIAAKAKNVLVLTEGVVPYLVPESVAELATDLFAQRNFRYWITDYFSPTYFEYYHRAGMAKKLGRNAPFRFFPENWEKFFRDAGWKLQTMKYLHDEAVRLGRPVPGAWFMKLIYRFIPHPKRVAMARMVGYALLERDRLTF